MSLHKNPFLKEVLEKLEKARFVGGAVRDMLLEVETYDIDIATTLVPSKVMEKLDGYNFHKTKGISHGTVSFTKKPWKVDITTLRKDVITDGRHAKVEFTEDWHQDAGRRDFTINAIYMDNHGEFFDPTGGMTDLKTGLVAFIGEGEKRVQEDYLRILRFLRFSGRFSTSLHQESWQACLKHMDGIDTLSGERIWQELSKIFPPPPWLCEFLEPVMEKIFRRKVHVKPGDKLDHTLFLASLIETKDELDMISKRLRLPRAKKRRILACTFDSVRNQESYVDSARLKGLEVNSPPPFPLRGEDLLPFKKGAELGKALKETKLWWFSHKGTFPSKKQVLGQLTKKHLEGET